MVIRKVIICGTSDENFLLQKKFLSTNFFCQKANFLSGKVSYVKGCHRGITAQNDAKWNFLLWKYYFSRLYPF